MLSKLKNSKIANLMMFAELEIMTKISDKGA